ncbi:Bardet-Biedl syndrome 4 protein [Paragonimus heterotremus]|uniref:Bardet-Biedl syndrome 4 protein n=1 Tax=Paragonimus heterotremus TaxID=100268 RepID=A0A8J4WI78_9TREM|nr:Bardet-Biedl syndrome 4 protein [Paragonimus heterotremus]
MTNRAPVSDVLPFETENWMIHTLFTQCEFSTCAELIKRNLNTNGNANEYALYCLGIIRRLEGKVQESLKQFAACIQLNTSSISYRKQIARSLLLLGKHDEAIKLYKDVTRRGSDDWETYYNQGLCYLYKKNYTLAEEYFVEASKCTQNVAPIERLACLHTKRGDYIGAVEILKQAISLNPENPELMTNLGLLYMKLGEEARAFEQLGSALTFQPNHFSALIAASTILLVHKDPDGALSKYRVAVKTAPESAILWNNIGLTLLEKRRMVAAISCLKRASYLMPLQWRVAANLGFVYLQTGQFISGYHYLNSALQMLKYKRLSNGSSVETIQQPAEQLSSKREFNVGTLHGLLALALVGLRDTKAALLVHSEACKSDQKNPALPLNLAIYLAPTNQTEAKCKLTEAQQRISQQNSDMNLFDTEEIKCAIGQLETLLKATEFDKQICPNDH